MAGKFFVRKRFHSCMGRASALASMNSAGEDACSTHKIYFQVEFISIYIYSYN